MYFPTYLKNNSNKSVKFANQCNFSLNPIVITAESMRKISFRNDILPLKNQLYRLALRITLNKEDAEDIVQDTLIRVWNKRDEWENIDSIEAYSLKICRNLALDHLKLHDNNNASLDSGEVEEPQTTPFERILQRDKIALVKGMIDSLPEKQRTTLQLREFEGKTYKEIALTLDISEDQVKINIFRARQAIKQRFQKLEEYGL